MEAPKEVPKRKYVGVKGQDYFGLSMHQRVQHYDVTKMERREFMQFLPAKDKRSVLVMENYE